MKEFYIPQYKETWIMTSEGKFPDGRTYYNFDIKGTEDTISHFSREEFDALLIKDVITNL